MELITRHPEIDEKQTLKVDRSPQLAGPDTPNENVATREII
jgi:hypothetical protein